MSQKKYLEATQSLERSLTRLDGGLKSVEGLSEIKEVLVNQKETLYSKLLEDLSKQIFTESTWEVLKSKQDQTPFQRTASNQGSRGSKRGSGTPLSGSGRKKSELDSRPGSGRRPERDARVRMLIQRGNNPGSGIQKMLTLIQEEEFEKIVKNPKLADLSEGPSHVVVIDIECLALLNQLPAAVDAIKSDLLNELQMIVTRSTQILIENGQYPQGISQTYTTSVFESLRGITNHAFSNLQYVLFVPMDYTVSVLENFCSKSSIYSLIYHQNHHYQSQNKF